VARQVARTTDKSRRLFEILPFQFSSLDRAPVQDLRRRLEPNRRPHDRQAWHARRMYQGAERRRTGVVCFVSLSEGPSGGGAPLHSPLPADRAAQVPYGEAETLAVRGLPIPSLADGRHDPSQHEGPADALVLGCLVVDPGYG
jgi:hypothetical protein